MDMSVGLAAIAVSGLVTFFIDDIIEIF